MNFPTMLFSCLLIGIVLFLSISLFIPIPKWQRLCRNLETRYVRPIAERRDLFLKCIVLLSILGATATIIQVYGVLGNSPSEWGRLLFEVAALAMAAFGFFFTIYGLRGVLDRPGNLDDVLIRTTALLNKYKDQHGYTVVMLCEYPAWGALSRQPSNEYTQFVAALEGFLVEDELCKTRKVILVAPSEDEMDQRIAQYSIDYKEQSNTITAQKANRELTMALSAITPKRFRHWSVDKVPRYQIMIIGQDTSPSSPLRPLEAMIWVAPLSSRENCMHENEATSTAESKANILTNPKGELEREVPVFAWQTTDRNLLTQLYESAFHYARDFAKEPPKNDQEFLSIPKQ